MALQRTLLERIRDPEPEGQRQLRVSTRVVFDSILNNLQKMLNTTHGNCLTDEHYGLPHMTSVRSAMPHSVAGFEAAIRVSIEKNEPRLRNVRVRHTPMVDSGMELRFEISALMVDEDGRQAVRFETYADSDGRLVVK